MTVSSDATSGMSAAAGDQGPGGGGQGSSGLIPAQADCFTPRPQTGPGPLSAVPEGRCLVLTGPSRSRNDGIGPAHGTGKTQLAAHLARTWQAENPGGPLIWLDENGEPNGHFDVFDYIKLCRDHYEKVGIGADYIDKLFR